MWHTNLRRLSNDDDSEPKLTVNENIMSLIKSRKIQKCNKNTVNVFRKNNRFSVAHLKKSLKTYPKM